MRHCNFAVCLKVVLLVTTLAVQAPDGPSQFCQDDAGPPWVDDAENFPVGRYHDGTPATAATECPPSLTEACAAKGNKAAFLEGPLDCGGAGWFCRITDQPGWINPYYNDKNFHHCNNTDGGDQDGHCHGSDTDDTYGWWIRDHWFRGYSGLLQCCCDWEATRGVVNRCDYRAHVDDAEACRDANEDHGKGFEEGCPAYGPIDDPALTDNSLCWTVDYFADPEASNQGGGDEGGEDEKDDEEDEKDDEEDEKDDEEDEKDDDENDDEEDTCEDSDAWLKNGKLNKGCDWVAKKVDGKSDKKRLKLCNKFKDKEKIFAAEACPQTCETCPGTCRDSFAWKKKNSNKGCDWVAKKVDGKSDKKKEKLCHKYVDSDGEEAYDACSVACDTCARRLRHLRA